MKFVTVAQRFGPFAQLLGPAAVIGFLALAEGQATFSGYPFQVLQECLYVSVAAGEQLFQRESLLRRIRVQRKGYPPEVNAVLLPEPVNTPGNEIAPGSDVIGKDFKGDKFCHDFSPQRSIYLTYQKQSRRGIL